MRPDGSASNDLGTGCEGKCLRKYFSAGTVDLWFRESVVVFLAMDRQSTSRWNPACQRHPNKRPRRIVALTVPATHMCSRPLRYTMPDSIPTTELCERFSSLYAGPVADVLDEMGYTDQTLERGIDPLADHMTVAGPAYTCRGRPNRRVDPGDNFENLLRMLRDVPDDGEVLFETNTTASAQLGELVTECLLAQEARGAILDGGIRDVSFLLEGDLPVFAKYRTPVDSMPRWELIGWDEPAVVGGVEVAPGDIVVGDADGVVVVPESIAVEVLQEAEAVAATEGTIRAELRDGQDPIEVFDEHDGPY